MEPGRAFHPPTTSVSVQAIYDSESIAVLVRWHDMSAEKTGTNGPSVPVPPEEEEEAPPQPTGGASTTGSAFGDEEVAPTQPGRRSRPQETPSPRPKRRQPASRPSSPTRSRSRSRRKFRAAPASPTSFSVTPRTRWISGSSISPAPSPCSSPAGEARTSRPTTRAISRRRHLRPGRMVGHLQAAPSRKRRRPVCAGAVHADRLFGLGRGLSGAWQPARSDLWYALYLEPEVVPSPVGPMIRTALGILVIEMAVIGWVRWRRRRDELGEASLAGALQRVRQPSAETDTQTTAGHQRELPGPFGGYDVQEHLRSRRQL